MGKTADGQRMDKKQISMVSMTVSSVLHPNRHRPAGLVSRFRLDPSPVRRKGTEREDVGRGEGSDSFDDRKKTKGNRRTAVNNRRGWMEGG